MAKVLNSQLTCLAHMKDGDLAEVLSWHDGELKPGEVIQRYKDAIIPIGKPMGKAYTELLSTPMSSVCYTNKVKILSSGTLIEL